MFLHAQERLPTLVSSETPKAKANPKEYSENVPGRVPRPATLQLGLFFPVRSRSTNQLAAVAVTKSSSIDEGNAFMHPAESTSGVSMELVALEVDGPDGRGEDEAGAAAATAAAVGTTTQRMVRKIESGQALSNLTSGPKRGLWWCERRLGWRAGAKAKKIMPVVR